MSDIDLSATYEFRPLPEALKGQVKRYAGGAWIDDDGEYDIAFVSGCDAPICLYVEVPHQRNIILSWLTTHWSGRVKGHPGGNPWHYALRSGESHWGGDCERHNHPNTEAGDAGMTYMCGIYRCANGRHVDLTKFGDPHVSAGLVRRADTKEVFTQTIAPCMYCGSLPTPR